MDNDETVTNTKKLIEDKKTNVFYCHRTHMINSANIMRDITVKALMENIRKALNEPSNQ